MLVYHDGYEYTFYIGARGEWTMHVFDLHLPDGSQWVASHYNVSGRAPRLEVKSRSTVLYNGWE